MHSEEAENNTKEEVTPANVVAKSKETKVEKLVTPKKAAMAKEAKPSKASQNSTPNQSRVSRMRRAPQRYGIDVIMAINEENED